MRAIDPILTIGWGSIYITVQQLNSAHLLSIGYKPVVDILFSVFTVVVAFDFTPM